ncbi:hypothetical protein AK812_SmicGene3934 [Symbiodinium microadriaticum]|uniref:Peptidase A2 domain-containing protein n=1 Tax=Symbiodinium microadriaticum TaxID=2951 RepID=A0A1Q9EXE7_SYMMI|nr:hypothetical protein AK812_SmicGene3934 [Symbiodinium microadriaticum]
MLLEKWRETRADLFQTVRLFGLEVQELKDKTTQLFPLFALMRKSLLPLQADVPEALKTVNEHLENLKDNVDSLTTEEHGVYEAATQSVLAAFKSLEDRLWRAQRDFKSPLAGAQAAMTQVVTTPPSDVLNMAMVYAPWLLLKIVVVAQARQALTGYTLEVAPRQLLKKWQALTGYTLEVAPRVALRLREPLKSLWENKQDVLQDDWERFVWQLETYAALVDSSFPGHLEEARRESDEAEEAVESEEYRQLSVKLFGMLVSLVSECAPALKIARGIRRQDGFLLWRQLWREFHPEQANRGLIWRRALLSPKFPSKESEFSAALQEWESDLAKYEAEFGVEKAISDEDKRALLMVESPGALKQHLAMTAGKLTKYEDVRGLVVSYLQAKRVWTPSGAYAQPAGRRHHDPDAMDIGRVGDAKGKDPKGKGKGKGKEDRGKGGKDRKGKEGKGKETQKEKEKEKCPICWRTGHTVKECWCNSKGKGKGAQQKGGVHAVSDDTASQLSAGPSASVAGSTATTAATAKPGVRHISDQKMRILAVSGERQGYLLVDTGATVSVCRPDTFLEPVNTAARQTLYSVDDTPLDTKSTVEPVLKLGRRSRQEAKTTFQVVSGITDDILSVNRAVDAGARVVLDAAGSYIEWEDGCTADFIRSGRQFLMPYTCARRPHKRARVAAVGEEEHYPDDPEAQAVADFARAEAAAEEERRELAEDPGGSLESGPPPPDREPVTESVPVEPTESIWETSWPR